MSDLFHAHLDECARCRNEPLNLCPKGNELLKASVFDAQGKSFYARRPRLVKACPDCGNDMVLRDSRFGPFYGCVQYPACESTHGAHKDGTPLGIPANKETRQARMAAHEAFDATWRVPAGDGTKAARTAAYQWLREQLGLPEDKCHIGLFDKALCSRVIKLCKEKV